MSDEGFPPDTPPVPRNPSGLYEHYCDHAGCSKWGGFGYQNGAHEQRWYCFDHREYGERHIGKA